ncbi:MAG: helix-turn-helix domain-containing protein [Pseudomonadota bacterium]
MREKKGLEAGAKKVDGRIARSRVQYDVIKTTFLELVNEGNYSPTAVDVAKRTGISVRTVFRHFSNIEELYAKIGEFQRSYVFENIPCPIEDSSWEDRLKQIIFRRRAVFEVILGSLEFVMVNRWRSPYLADAYQQMLDESRQFLELALHNHVDITTRKFDTLVILFSPGQWRMLRKDFDLTVDEAVQWLFDTAIALYPSDQ